MSAFLFVSLFSSILVAVQSIGCYKEVPGPWPSVVLTKIPHQYINIADLPANFDWRNVNNTCYVSPPTNQLIPYPCGSCWAHAATGALTDRFIIATKGQVAMPHLSMQALLDCGEGTSVGDLGSCSGGSDIKAYEFIHKYGITDVTCSPYMGVTSTNWGEGVTCPERMCKQCDIHGSCHLINGTKYYIMEFGSILGEDEMMTEIYARGPIACHVYAHSPAFLDYTNGIISDPTDYGYTTHVVVVTGWGVDAKGTKYWIGRNSFGTSWGEVGWFKLERGKNTLDIERHNCTWAVPKLM